MLALLTHVIMIVVQPVTDCFVWTVLISTHLSKLCCMYAIIFIRLISHVYVCMSRYFTMQSALGHRRQPDDDDSDVGEVSDDEFDAFLGKFTSFDVDAKLHLK